MKLLKLLPLLSLALTFSCSTTDNDPESPESPQTTTPTLNVKWILEKWNYNSVNQNLTSCKKQSFILFNSNGTFERKDYILINSNCIIEDNDNGNYSYNTSNSKITLTFVDPDDGPQTEVWNNVAFDNSLLKFTWDEDNNGSDEHSLEYKK